MSERESESASERERGWVCVCVCVHVCVCVCVRACVGAIVLKDGDHCASLSALNSTYSKAYRSTETRCQANTVFGVRLQLLTR